MNFFQQTNENLLEIREKNIPAYQVFMLAFQHMFAMFGATILVPLLTGLDPAVALFTSGLGTIVFHILTKGKVPVYLGSSFVFIAPLASIILNESGQTVQENIPQAMAGVVVAGLVYVIMAILIKIIGPGFFRKLLPPVVIGPVIITIGLGLSGAIRDYITVPAALAQGLGERELFLLQSRYVLTAFITLAVVIAVYLLAKGILRLVPILAGLVVGYLFAVTQGLVDFTPVREAAWFAIPGFTFPDFSSGVKAITLIAPLAIATMVEHLGDIEAIGRTTGKDFIKEPGLHRTLIGDGIATALAGFLGGPPNTTYSENTGVLILTKVYNPFVVLLAAILVVCFSFIGKIGALIQTIPSPVIGGISLLLFGLIATVGFRTLKENNVDLNNNRNVVLISVILIVALSGLSINIWKFSFSGMGLGAILGVILNLILPEKIQLASGE